MTYLALTLKGVDTFSSLSYNNDKVFKRAKKKQHYLTFKFPSITQVQSVLQFP